MFCTACGASIAEQSKFCGTWGSKQEQPLGVRKISENVRSSMLTKNRGLVEHPASRSLFVTDHSFANTLQDLLSEVNGYNSNVISTLGNNNEELANLCKKYLNKFDNICVVGGFGDISSFQVPNPAAGPDDPDEWCFTDSIYGSEMFIEDDVESAIPKIGVSRIPTLNEETIRKLLNTTELNGNVHDQFCFGVTAEMWHPATEKIFKEAGLNIQSLFSAPDWEHKSIKLKINEVNNPDKARVYLFNVHGGGDSTEWVGDSESNRYEPIVLSPVALRDMSDSVLISEACYGGAMQYDEPSIVEQFFSSNGKAFVGCSVVAYGNPGVKDMPLFSADVIALSLIKNLGQGLSLAESLKNAKQYTLESALSVCGDEIGLDVDILGRYATKAILSFNAYGCPWLKFSHRSSIFGADVVSSTASVDSSSLGNNNRLNDVRSRINSRLQSSQERISNRLSPLRARYRSKLPIKSQLYLVSIDESLSAFRSFRDADRIEKFLKNNSLSVSECRFYKSKKDGVDGYLLSIGKSMANNKAKETFAIVTNGKGELKIIIGSK